MIADRTAIESRPSKDGVIHLISDKTREVKIPGYVIKPRSGHSALASDHNFIGGLKICSRERALLENIRLSRGQTSFLPKTLTQNELENKLENILTTEGEEALNTLRDKAYKISNEIKEPDLYKKLNHLIGLFLGTRKGEGRNPLL